jgi:hypothetical protein
VYYLQGLLRVVVDEGIRGQAELAGGMLIEYR